MREVIGFTAAEAYPTTATLLDEAEVTLLIAIRHWTAAYRERRDPLPPLRPGLGAAGAPDAAFAVNALMAIVARTLRRPMAVHCPCCPKLSEDEQHLLHAASLVQAGECALAQRALRTALLAAPGADFALGPLEGLGRVFARAGLLFGCRRSPAGEAMPEPEGCSPGDVDQCNGASGDRTRRYFSLGVRQLVALMAADRAAASGSRAR
jgi:hypothetical protein